MKIDLTLDLIGAAPPRLIADMARAKDMDLGGLFTGDGYDLRHGVLAAYDAVASVVRGPRDLARLADAVLGDGYSELRLDATEGWDDLVAGIGEGAAGRDHAVIARLSRRIAPERRRALAVIVAEAGAPLAMGEPDDWCLDLAAEAGVPVIVDGLHSRARRIRCATLSDAMAEELAEAGTGVELTDWTQAGRLYDRGVTLCVGRGFAAFEPLDLQARLHDAFDWDDAVFADLDRKALAVAVCDDTTRHRLKEMTHAR